MFVLIYSTTVSGPTDCFPEGLHNQLIDKLHKTLWSIYFNQYTLTFAMTVLAWVVLGAYNTFGLLYSVCAKIPISYS